MQMKVINYKIQITSWIFLISLSLIPYSSFAGGFQVNLQGQKQTGMGHTGTGLLLDGSSIFFNPGAMCFIDSLHMINVGGSFIFPRVEYLEPTPGTYTAQMNHNVDTPFSLYFVYKRKKEDRINFGLGVYTPFGSLEQWPSDWKGQFLLRQIDLKAIFIQPTVSYKVTDKIGIGVGLVYSINTFSLEQGIPVQDASGNYGQASLSGSANAFGYNAGIYFKPNNKFSVGLDYRSSVKVKMTNGTANFTVPSALKDSFPNTTFSSTLTLPSTTTLGFGYVVNEKLKLALDINYVGWSVYDTLAFNFAKNTTLLKNVHSPRDYKNVFIYRVGAQYQLTQKVFVRCGAYFDSSPAPDGYITPETPDANKIGVTAGASWRISKKFNMDFSFLYIQSMKRFNTNIETKFSGTFQEKAVVPGIGIEYLF